MPADLNATAAALRESPLVDSGALLKPAGRQEVLAAIEKWRARGLRPYVVITQRNDELAPWHALWSTMSLDSKRDLLLLFNGTRWEARGWGLGEARIHQALQNAEAGLREYYGRGLVMALDQLGAAATGSPVTPSPASRLPTAQPASESSGSSVGIVAAVVLALVAVLFGWTLRRRKLMGGQRLAEFDKARLAAEQTYADIVLAAEGLADQGTEEKRRASELRSRLDGLQREARARPMSANDPVLLGKVQQLENEIAAIHSVILQKTKGN